MYRKILVYESFVESKHFFNLQDATKLQFIENLDKPGEFQAQFRVKLISK